MDLLERILADKRRWLDSARARQPAAALQPGPPPPPFAAALRRARVGLIAEVKRRSPSAGVLREPFDPAAIARAYQGAGAQAVSVLMDAPYFGGGVADWFAVRDAVVLPLLYKEFVVDPWQIAHARSLGAAAVLLIAAALPGPELAEFRRDCEGRGMAALVEVHDEAELERAIAAGAGCIGVNNRDLRTFRVSLDTSLRLGRLCPAGCTLVSESGIRGADDVRRLRDGGFHAVLVGEHLLRQPDVGAAVRALMGDAWASS